MLKDKFRVSNVFYRIYHKKGDTTYYSDPDYDIDDAMHKFEFLESDPDCSEVIIRKVVETEEIIRIEKVGRAKISIDFITKRLDAVNVV